MDNNIWKTLYDRAKAVQWERQLSPLMEVGSVGAAVLTDKGNIYTGICIDTASGMGFCAERNAIANMLTNGENKITKVVAVMPDGSSGMPCGVCREFMMQMGPDSKNIEILLSLEPLKTVKLGDQLPDWWGEKLLDKADFHILNGDFALMLWEKFRSGASLVWKETYIEGPLPQTDDLHIFRNARAEYLATFAELENIGTEKLYRHLQKMDDTILELPENTRLTLWFDSCIFDQTILMRILYLLSRRTTPLPEILQYCCDGNSLTEKDFSKGQPLLLHSSDVKLGAKAWKTFVARDPDELRKLADTRDFNRMPAMKKALLRCADEIPDPENLTRTQRQILQILSQKSCSFVEIFQALDKFEEYPFLGDTACQRLLNDLVTKGRIRNIAADLYCLLK